MLVTIYSEAGEIVGAGPQKPDLQKTARGYSWTLNYLFPEKEPNGRLEIVVNGTDRVGNAASISTHILAGMRPPQWPIWDQQTLPGDESSGIQSMTRRPPPPCSKAASSAGRPATYPTDSAPYLTEAGLGRSLTDSAGRYQPDAGLECVLPIQ
jgi:hypothetical protein